MNATIIRFEGPYAICMRDDRSIMDIKRINIPMDAREGDILNINGSNSTLERHKDKENYIIIDDIIVYL